MPTRLLPVTLALIAIVFALGCRHHLVGTHDVALEYRVASGVAKVWEKDRPLLARAMRRRLAFARVGADVSASGDVLRIVVDSASEQLVDRLARWEGGMEIAGEDLEVDRADLVAKDKRALAITLTARGRDRIARAARTHPDERLPLRAFGLTLEEVRVAELAAEDPITVRFGDDLRAYERARTARSLLLGPPFPRLDPVGRTALALNAPLAATTVLLPLAVSLAWLALVRRFDRARPEPMTTVLVTFALGAAGFVLAAIVEPAAWSLSPYLDPRAMAKGRELADVPADYAVTLAVVGFVEEGVKLAAVWLFARRRKEFDEPIDGVLYATAAALGFAALENIDYAGMYRMAGGVVSTRVFQCAPVHVFFSAVWGYALGRRLVYPRTRVLPYLLVAAAAHALYDVLCEFAVPYGPEIFGVVLGVVFVALLRRALRHGAAKPGEEAPASAARELFPVGSRVLFLPCAGLVLSIAWMLIRAGAEIDDALRLDVEFITKLSLLLVVFVGAAWAVTVSMPLDVVLDARGLTYAGASFEWREILGAEPELDRGLFGASGWLKVSTSRGPLSLGPASPEIARRLAGAIGERLAKA